MYFWCEKGSWYWGKPVNSMQLMDINSGPFPSWDAMMVAWKMRSSSAPEAPKPFLDGLTGTTQLC